MNHLAIQLVSLPAFALLALAMDRHQLDLFGRELPAGQTRGLRMAGWLALLASLAIAVALKGWSLGLVTWCGHISLSAAIVILTMVAWERRKSVKK